MIALEKVGKIEIVHPIYKAEQNQVLTPAALDFLISLHERFEPKRQELLEKRAKRQFEINNGQMPDFLASTSEIRKDTWSVASAPADLDDRRVEITGPVERKMMINALNSGARVFMADFEDSLSPTWENILDGQINCMDAVRRTLSFESPEGKKYQLGEKTATLVVRPRGFHLEEKHLKIGGQPISASFFDFGLYFFHNAHELLKRESGPYFYLPKMESHLEARLWNDVFIFSQEQLSIEQGTIRATVLIETILAAFEMEEILFELKEHASGLNAGRWDYIFSLIKKMSTHPRFSLPDRAQITMAVPFMKAYSQLLVKTCHKRGAHAIGGMAAFIPSRKDPQINQTAISKVKEDKLRESGDGFDGTWVAHPDLVPIAMEIFDQKLGANPNQKSVLREDVNVSSAELLNVTIDGGKVTRQGLVNNIDVALRYLDSWLSGVGAAAIHNLMEDAATAEIARAQIWQWIYCSSHLEDSINDRNPISDCVYEEIRQQVADELAKGDLKNSSHLSQACEILDKVILKNEFTDFITIPAYEILESHNKK